MPVSGRERAARAAKLKNTERNGRLITGLLPVNDFVGSKRSLMPGKRSASVRLMVMDDAPAREWEV